jgi:hypothetical protein
MFAPARFFFQINNLPENENTRNSLITLKLNPNESTFEYLFSQEFLDMDKLFDFFKLDIILQQF